MDTIAASPDAWRGRITLGHLLHAAGSGAPDHALAIRHTFTEASLKSAAHATPEALLAHTRRQSVSTLKFPKTPAAVWLVFLADGGRRSRLVSAYDNHGEVASERTEVDRFFDLRPSDFLSELHGRLVVDWSADTINWTKSATKASAFVVREIADPSIVSFPGFDRLHLRFHELRAVVNESRYENWRTALASVQGIYLITDSADGRLYVGKTGGGERVLGRWQDYARDGHGGNVLMRALLAAQPDHADHLSWSLLRVFGPQSTSLEVSEAEEHFKRVLGSRAFGLNAN